MNVETITAVSVAYHRSASEPPAVTPISGSPAKPAMSLPLLPRVVRRSRLSALIIGGLVALFGGIVLVVATARGQVLLPEVGQTSFFPTAASTVLALFLCGLSLAAAVLGDPKGGSLRDGLVAIAAPSELRGFQLPLPPLRLISRVCGGLAALIGGQALLRQLLVFVREAGATNQVRMAAALALYFVVLGVALCVLDYDPPASSGGRASRLHRSELLAFCATWLGELVLTGTLLRMPRLYHLDSSLTVALPTALAMMALALGVLAARPERGIARIALSATAGGTLMRGLVPATLLVPPFGMWLLVEILPRWGLFDARLGTVLSTMVGCVVVTGLEAVLATRLATADGERMEHQSTLRRALSDLGQAMRERDRSRRDLARSNRDLDEFAYAASHDLRAPLRGIANLAQWIEEDLGAEVPGTTRQQLELLRGRVQRMEKMIDDILTYSRAGRSNDPPRLTAVADLLRETLELVAAPPAARIEIGPNMPELVTQRVQLQQIFMNLISNAIKHSRREDPHVIIAAEDQGEFIRFEVGDNGPGVPIQYHERIFGMFQTLLSRDQVEGTGIGLATVKKLVERHGGRVGVESSEGAGARFFFLWPKHQLP